MRPSIVIAALAVVGVLGGGAWFGLEVYPQQRFRAGLDQALATLPPGTTATYKSAHYSVLTHQAVVTGWAVHGAIPGDTPQPFDIFIDSIETTNPNQQFSDAWSRALANPAAYAQDAAVPLADAVEVKGIVVRSDLFNLTESSIQIAKPRIYPWALLHDGMPSWRDIQASVTAGIQSPQSANPLPLLRAEAAGVLGVAYDSYTARDTHVQETIGRIDADYDIHEMTADAFDRGVMHGGTVNEVTVRDKLVGTFSIDDIAIGAIDIREPMIRLMDGEALSPALLDKVTIGRLAYTGISARPPGQAEIHAAGFSVGPLAFAKGLPVAGELGWTDVMFSKLQLPDPRAWEVFNELGLETMTISVAMAYNWDVAHQRVSIHDTMLKVNELGTLMLSADLDGIAPGAAATGEGSVAHATLRLLDASLVERLLRMGATRTGSDPADYRALIVTTLRRQAEAGHVEMAAAARAVAAFIASPRTLTVELSPPTPVPFLTLRNAVAAPTSLVTIPGLSVSANQP